MIRYHLDDLGWYQFEALVQSLLKAEAGMTVESWGGHSDRGRDAFAKSPLRFPHRKKESEGPFVFQAKFVQGANAKGAKPRRGLLSAVEAEAREIKRRQVLRQWEPTKWYVLLTNAPLPSSTRSAIAEILKPVIPGAELVMLGGKDVSDLLDLHPELRRSFPEIMSLRDLDALLRDVVTRSILERSKSAIEEAREVVTAFVQTENYHKAIQILKKHNFVVLDGPPEMGKTAIARVLSLAQLTLGWEALDCRVPDDLFSSYDSHLRQVFIVDDAFGRTEYEPTLGRLWEKDLSKVLHKIDQKHWLIWTTRKHILARALKDMDLVGKAASFPEPAELIVTADDLSTEEKAKILYRHARAGELETMFRSLIRVHASLIVRDDHFTPERIRRFINERIPELAKENESKPLSAEELQSEIIEAIHDPTKRMQKAYSKLSKSHKWILISLLDCGAFATVKDLKSRYSQHRSQLSEEAFAEALDELVGTFVKLSLIYRREYVDWIHPSYRDLVIDELMVDLEQQVIFVRNASLIGLSLALSEAGGSAGKRALPFLRAKDSWQALRMRSLELINAGSESDIERIIRLLFNSFSAETHDEVTRERIGDLLREVLGAVHKQYVETHSALGVDTLRTYLVARSKLNSELLAPNLDNAWEAATTRLRDMLESDDFISQYVVDEWSKLARVIEMYVPEVFEDLTRLRNYKDDLEQLRTAMENELDSMDTPDDKDEISQGAERLRSLAGSLSELSYDEVIGDEDITKMISRLENRAETYEEQAEKDDDDTDDSSDDKLITSEVFDINAFFADL